MSVHDDNNNDIINKYIAELYAGQNIKLKDIINKNTQELMNL